MEAVCILLRIDPVKIKSKDGVGYIKDYWLASTGKHVLGNNKLVDILTSMDHNSMDSVSGIIVIFIIIMMCVY